MGFQQDPSVTLGNILSLLSQLLIPWPSTQFPPCSYPWVSSFVFALVLWSIVPALFCLNLRNSFSSKKDFLTQKSEDVKQGRDGGEGVGLGRGLEIKHSENFFLECGMTNLALAQCPSSGQKGSWDLVRLGD